jgi:hypothetical protein
MRLMPRPTFRGWSCSCLRLDRLVCGGPPQLSNCWRGRPAKRCGCLSYGSRSSQRTGGHRVAALSHKLQTAERASSGTPSTSSPQN